VSNPQVDTISPHACRAAFLAYKCDDKAPLYRKFIKTSRIDCRSNDSQDSRSSFFFAFLRRFLRNFPSDSTDLADSTDSTRRKEGKRITDNPDRDINKRAETKRSREEALFFLDK